MRNNSFFEKLTGSLRLSDADLNALNEPDTQVKQDNKIIKSSSTTNKAKDDDYDEIIEEVDEDDFEIPDDENIETIEEIIEDDSIDEEEVEEYYEEIIDEDDEISPEINTSIYGDTNKYTEDVVVENTHNDYPVFKMRNDIDSEVHNKEKEEVAVAIPEAKIEHKEMFSSLESDLPIDLFEMHNEIVLRVLVPGITPENLKVSITRDHVSLTCTRPSPEGIDDSSYFEREIPYGDFTRMIHLPSDVDVEHAEAVEKYGLLIIRLPKLDSKKVQELKIKSV